MARGEHRPFRLNCFLATHEAIFEIRGESLYDFFFVKLKTLTDAIECAITH